MVPGLECAYLSQEKDRLINSRKDPTKLYVTQLNEIVLHCGLPGCFPGYFPLTLDYKLASSVVQAHLMAVLHPQVDNFFSHPFRFLREQTRICFVKSFPKWGVFVNLSLLGQPFKYKINIILCIPPRRNFPGCHHCFRKKQRYLPEDPVSSPFYRDTFCPSRCPSQDMSVIF